MTFDLAAELSRNSSVTAPAVNGRKLGFDIFDEYGMNGCSLRSCFRGWGMKESYLNPFDRSVAAVIKGIDRDVARGEDILMLGFGLVLLAPIFAPLLPPRILLPLMALTFALSTTMARRHFHNMERRLSVSMILLEAYEQAMLRPVADIFVEHPRYTLAEAFNPLKNLNRTAKSVLGGFLINPLWMPIFYMLGIQFNEEKQLSLLNKAVIGVEQRIAPHQNALNIKDMAEDN
jgi:hypothetical protein